MSRNFKPNQAGIHALANSPEMYALCLSVAAKGMAEAEALSADFIETGDYASSFRVEAKEAHLLGRTGWRTVASAVLSNDSPHAAAVEWGNARSHRKHRVLGRVLDGLKRHE